MFKFFNRIRRQLLEENNIQKYLSYAFGEIILVVVGILIALAINNWNEDKKADRQLDEILAGIQNDLILDTAQNSFVYQDLKTKDENGQHLSDFIFGKPGPYDTMKLKTAFLEANTFQEFSPISTSYQTLISTEAIHRIKNIELVKSLNEYYQPSTRDLAYRKQRERFSMTVGDQRFKHLPQGALRTHLQKTIGLGDWPPDYLEQLKLDWETLKKDDLYREYLERRLSVNVGHYDELLRNQMAQKQLIRSIEEYRAK